jgi:EAL domain-containing protein (putative c-di-GMP-specific phosphodiesterase class I)
VPRPDRPTDAELVGDLLLQGLDVAYQPIIDLATRELVGWEALLRGSLPAHGTVSPEHVVGSATRVGALDPVMRQITEQALTTAMVASMRLGRRMVVSVNVEPDQLRSDSRFLRWVVDRSASCPAQLVLEITERGDGAAWGEEQDEALDRIRAGGVGLAIDDLGSGVSRLRLLGRHEWSWVKLDRDFLLLGERGLILLRHTVAMLHELGTTVVLEGIETAGQLAIAHEAGVDLVQGNLLGRPATAGDLLAGIVPRQR